MAADRRFITAVVARVISARLALAAFFPGAPAWVMAVEGFVIVATIAAWSCCAAAPAARSLTMGRIRFILVGAVIGLAWAASLRGFMMVLAGPDSTFTFTGTFGIIIPTGIIVGALLGWAEHQRHWAPSTGCSSWHRCWWVEALR